MVKDQRVPLLHQASCLVFCAWGTVPEDYPPPLRTPDLLRASLAKWGPPLSSLTALAPPPIHPSPESSVPDTETEVWFYSPRSCCTPCNVVVEGGVARYQNGPPTLLASQASGGLGVRVSRLPWLHMKKLLSVL